MPADSNVAPVIIKRKKVSGGHVHHGGAWKVAYADFVTAMMAFFLLMWLLNATTEKQRKGIADYFNPNVPINQISGGGDAMFGGRSVFESNVFAKNGNGSVPDIELIQDPNRTPETAGAVFGQHMGKEDEKAFGEVTDYLMGGGGESLLADNVLKHVVTRQSDEGLVIEVFDLPDRPLFNAASGLPTDIMTDLMRAVAGAADLVSNAIAVEGYVAALPRAVAHDTSWDHSLQHATTTRKLLERSGLAADRLLRVTGHGDREALTVDPMEPRNNRIKVIFLRSDIM